MELWVANDPTSDLHLAGKYRYQGKTAFLDLEGQLYGGDVLWLEEWWSGEVSGNFYLEYTGEGEWNGRWIGNGTFHETQLITLEGDRNDLMAYDLNDLKAKATKGISGSYALDEYFINEMWFTEENPAVEVGFNGGVVTAKEVDDMHVQIEFQFVCGPTYHLAFFSGEATRIGKNSYEFNEPWDEGEEESCHLVFNFKDKQLEIKQFTAGYHCGFGARAYAEGTYDKVSDKVVEGGEDGPNLRDLWEK